MRITSEIFVVGGGDLTEPRDAAVYLIAFGGSAALVDAGCGTSTEVIAGHVRRCGVDPTDITHILLTHCHFDHTGGAAALRASTGARTVAHELEASFIEKGDPVVTAAQWYGSSPVPCPVDIRLSDGEADLTVGDRAIRAIHIPGHSPGSVAYLVESSGKRVLFGQDVHGPLDPSLKSDPKSYRQSLSKLASLDADILCEGHYGVVEGRERVRDFIRSFLI
ncbi:MAG: MBL fold metallo-hydrolase [Planctomycetota bacterium]|jgi:glyoxylase-like metal-dependent hydrolase (beta-lactamase superfamily II)